MVDFKGLEGLYDDINQVGSRPVGLMTEFKTESGRPIYISHNGEIVSEKSTTIPYNGKYVNVPSIHDGIEYSEFELIKLLDEKKIKPTSTHKTQQLAVKAAQKRSPSLMSEETARAVESKYWKEMTKRKATADQILGDSSTELVTPDAKAERRMDDLQAIQEDQFLDLYGEGEKSQKLDAYMSTLSEDDKSDMQSYLNKPTPKINSIEGDEAMAKGRARRNDVDETVTAFNEGGYEDGGLKDEGGTVDPVSGNDVPSGSTQAEVRDDIPAQLSEGEFVFPADVVRYIGLENLMELRSKAKQGLAKMEAMGQMGNSDEATMDDSGEYDGEIDELIESFDPNDPSTFEFNEGGVVMAQQGTYVPGQTQQQFSYGYMPPQQQNFQAPVYSVMPQQTQFITDPARVAVGQGPVAVENRTYVGPNGEEIIIPFYDGKPMQGYTIPGGYKYKSPEEAVAETPKIAAPVVQQPDDGGGDGGRDNRESYDNYRSNMDKLSALDEKFGTGKFSEEWNNSVHKQKGFSLGMLNVGANIAADFARGVAADAVISEIAGKYGLNPNDFKQTGFGRLQPGEYDVDKFLKGAAAARAPVTREETGLKSGFIDENTYIDSEGNERDVTAKSAATKRGLAKEAERPSVTPIGYDDTEDEASGRTSSGPSGPQGDPYDEQSGPSGPPGGSNASDDPSEEGSTGGGGFESSSSAGYDYASGGLAEQTERALKSSRKK